jgi:hypothetical protein
MEAVFPIMLQMAIAEDRLTIGRGNELVTHDTRIWSAQSRQRPGLKPS